MKKPTLQILERQCRLAAYKARATKKRRKYLSKSRKKEKYVRPGEKIRAPIYFQIFGPYGSEVLKFIAAVSQTVLKLKIPVTLDFRSTQLMSAEATILLYAELDRLAHLSELEKPMTILDPYTKRAREVLKQIGIHDITKDTCNTIPSREDVVYWRATKGVDQSGENLAVLEVIADRVNQSSQQQVEVGAIWRGVSEAVANSVEHAYKFPRKDNFQGLQEVKWWMFTQLRDNVFTIAVCDLGCGYAETVPKNIPEFFISKFQPIVNKKNKDAYAIELAMEYGRSSTKQSERGKGSRDAISVVKNHGSGSLAIMSNNGVVKFKLKKGEISVEHRARLSQSIKGSIVVWKLPLEKDV